MTVESQKNAHLPPEGLEGKLKELPLLPAVMTRLLGLNHSHEDYFDELVAVLENDPQSVIRILEVANSAASAPSSQITSLRAAVARLGPQQAVDIVTSAAVTQTFAPRSEGQRSLWIHSIQTATAARAIAARGADASLEPETAYIAGLLHDVGRFPMFGESPEEVAPVDDAGRAAPDALAERERDLYGFDHAELGWHVCQAWGLPEDLAVLIRDHHGVQDFGAGAPAHAGLRATLGIADALSALITSDADYPSADAEQRVRLVAEHCIPAGGAVAPIEASDLAALADEIESDSIATARSLGLMPRS